MSSGLIVAMIEDDYAAVPRAHGWSGGDSVGAKVAAGGRRDCAGRKDGGGSEAYWSGRGGCQGARHRERAGAGQVNDIAA